MGRIGPRRERFEVLPEPVWTVADIIGAARVARTQTGSDDTASSGRDDARIVVPDDADLGRSG